MITLISNVHTLYLPNPELGDTANIPDTFDTYRSVNGTRRTYVRAGTTQLLSYTFLLSRMKSEELKVFVDNNIDSFFRLQNHLDETWRVKLISNPVDYVNIGRGKVSANLQFEGEQI